MYSLGQESKQTLQLAGPIILGELVQMSLHIIDAAMVGAVSHVHLAASALVFGIINIPFVFGIGLSIAVSQMVALANGQRDASLVSHYFFNGIIICLVAACGISGLLYFGSDIVFHLNQQPEVAILAKPFLELMSLSMIPMILFIACKQFTDGLEYTKVAMIISIMGMPMNIGINWLLIYGNAGFPRLELVGAGWGTLITRTVMLMVLILYIIKSKLFAKYIKVARRQWRINLQSWKQMLHIGIPSALQIVLEAGAFAISGILVGMIGSEEQAAHQIALQIASFTFMVSMGLSQAGSIRVSNALGAFQHKKIAIIGRSAIIMALAYGILCAIFFTIFNTILPTFFNKNIEVISIAGSLLLAAAIFQIPDTLQAVSAGMLRGIRDVKVPTIYIGIAYWVFGMPIGVYLMFQQDYGPMGIWIGFIIGLTIVGSLLVTRFLKKSRIAAADQGQ